MMKYKYFYILVFLLSVEYAHIEAGELINVVPQWAKEAIWYQIFPDRFWNGDSSNDPILDDMAGAWPYFRPENWQVHPWTSDWYKQQLWEKVEGKDFYWYAGLRRYGGDLQGVLDRLDYLKGLGVSAIYFNPLFESPSHHKYDATMYHHIDNNFGPQPDTDRVIWDQENPADPNTWNWTSADSLFLHLIQECHSRDIRVIIDGVFNHVGSTFWAFQDVVKNQKYSEYQDWFIIHQWDNPSTVMNEFKYQGWFGVRDLPEIREDENGLVDGPREHIHAIVQRWMDPNGDGNPSDGIDGWRLDVAEKVNMNFWREFREWVKGINSSAYLTGEIWWEDWPNNEMYNAAPWLQGDVFDGVMNYRWGRAAKQFVIDVKNKINANAFADSIQAIFRDYPEEKVYVLQNMLSSHDIERLASQIVNPDRWLDHGGNPTQDSNFKVRKPSEEDLLKQKLIVGIQMTCPGAPIIYYGDEVGMWGGDDPDCRKPMIWPELNHEPEISHPYGKFRPTDLVSFNHDLYQWYKTLIRIRNENKALSLGTIRFLSDKFSDDLLGYLRRYHNNHIMVLLNSSNEQRTKRLDVTSLSIDVNYLIDLITGQEYVVADETFDINIQPYQIYILEIH